MRSTLLTSLLALLTLPAAAQTNLSLMTTPWRAASPIDAGGDVTFIPTETDGAGSPDLDLSIFRVAGRVRPNPDAENKLTLGYEFFRLGLNTSDPVLPDDLTNAALAAGAKLGQFNAFDYDWNWGGSVGLGFTADNHFGDSNGWYALGSLFANTRLTDTRSLMVGLDFDGNRAIFPDLPLPPSPTPSATATPSPTPSASPSASSTGPPTTGSPSPPPSPASPSAPRPATSSTTPSPCSRPTAATARPSTPPAAPATAGSSTPPSTSRPASNSPSPTPPPSSLPAASPSTRNSKPASTSATPPTSATSTTPDTSASAACCGFDLSPLLMNSRLIDAT